MNDFKKGDKILVSPLSIGYRDNTMHPKIIIGKKYKAIFKGKAIFAGHGYTFDLEEALDGNGRTKTGFVSIDSPSLGGGDWKITPRTETKYNTDTWKMPG